MTAIGIALAVFSVFCGWRLVSKTGNPGWLCFLFYIPYANIIMLLYFVFADWPVQSELRRYKERSGDLAQKREIDDMSSDTTCLQCGGIVPAGTPRCSSCGWTYTTENDYGIIMPSSQGEL